MSPLIKSVRTASAGFVLVALGWTLASAQTRPATAEVTPSHFAAASEVVAANKASKQLDNILPALAGRVQATMTNMRPDLFKQIGDVVDETALKLVSRRADLDADIARIYAKHFSEAELKAIVIFYKSPAGAKLVELQPQVNAEAIQAANSWSVRVNEDMTRLAREELKRRGIDF